MPPLYWTALLLTYLRTAERQTESKPLQQPRWSFELWVWLNNRDQAVLQHWLDLQRPSKNGELENFKRSSLEREQKLKHNNNLVLQWCHVALEHQQVHRSICGRAQWDLPDLREPHGMNHICAVDPCVSRGFAKTKRPIYPLHNQVLQIPKFERGNEGATLCRPGACLKWSSTQRGLKWYQLLRGLHNIPWWGSAGSLILQEIYSLSLSATLAPLPWPFLCFSCQIKAVFVTVCGSTIAICRSLN